MKKYFFIYLVIILFLFIFYIFLNFTINKESFNNVYTIVYDIQSIIWTNNNNNNNVSMLSYINDSTTINDNDRNYLSLSIINFEYIVKLLFTLSSVPSSITDVFEKQMNDMVYYISNSCMIIDDKKQLINYLSQINDNLLKLKATCQCNSNNNIILIPTPTPTPM